MVAGAPTLVGTCEHRWNENVGEDRTIHVPAESGRTTTMTMRAHKRGVHNSERVTISDDNFDCIAEELLCGIWPSGNK